MLIMMENMDHGSLYKVLDNETVHIESNGGPCAGDPTPKCRGNSWCLLAATRQQNGYYGDDKLNSANLQPGTMALLLSRIGSMSISWLFVVTQHHFRQMTYGQTLIKWGPP
eukprot:scaffold792_cov84-Cylindrotheca_fusiformis.AAC.14